MYAQLGDIVFQGLIGFNSFDHSKEANLVEHALIDGKPILQRVGTNLDKIRIDIMFHVAFCNPEAQLRAMDSARDNGDVLPFILGNGTDLGDFVIKSTSQTTKQLDGNGGIREVTLSVELVEHVEGDALTAAIQAAISAGFANAQNSPAQASIAPATALASSSEAAKASALVVATSASAQGVNVALNQVSQFPAQVGYQLAVIGSHTRSMQSSIQALQALIANPGSVQNVTTALAAHLPTLLSTVNTLETQAGGGSLSSVQATNAIMQTQVETMRSLSNGLAALKASR